MVPWVPVTSVEMVPFKSGGDTLDDRRRARAEIRSENTQIQSEELRSLSVSTARTEIRAHTIATSRVGGVTPKRAKRRAPIGCPRRPFGGRSRGLHARTCRRWLPMNKRGGQSRTRLDLPVPRAVRDGHRSERLRELLAYVGFARIAGTSIQPAPWRQASTRFTLATNDAVRGSE